ncbi:MAG: hypothetical protein IPH54_21755 [Rhodoferax sp.]|nr:hypothetical protein [Rhodoferax sp.]
MTVRVIGVRHHSPACAGWSSVIAQRKPAAVLIEGPGDFNPRLGELMLEHTLPVALYSYANEGTRPAQCWFPFLDYSPEWVALRSGQQVGALLRFIDLPHWQYRAIADTHETKSGLQPRTRYAEVLQLMCQRFGCDGGNALWDHLFEGELEDAVLQQRLDLYSAALPGYDPGPPQDQARELQWHAGWPGHTRTLQVMVGGDVLVICGGWHKRAIESSGPSSPQGLSPCRLSLRMCAPPGVTWCLMNTARWTRWVATAQVCNRHGFTSGCGSRACKVRVSKLCGTSAGVCGPKRWLFRPRS